MIDINEYNRTSIMRACLLEAASILLESSNKEKKS